MSAPPALQIREANAHLAAVHRRAAELEARLEAAERTVSAQAERLTLQDQQLRAALDELGHAKDREIAALQEQLLTSEAAIHSLQAAVRQRDELIQQLQPRAKLLQDICRRRPPLVALLADLAEAERLGPLPASDPGHLLPSGPGPPLANSTGFSVAWTRMGAERWMPGSSGGAWQNWVCCWMRPKQRVCASAGTVMAAGHWTWRSFCGP
uniref:vimentin-type intermediate filament-associated coiled-coil protein isoform X1 n=1 Tax=Urocitellus parryii TaxID=9999 RepID=UPI000E55EBB7|nr:vimentin-type intermediate filament-associated coiled-coil protein isoform X1 [Urocitellus parryii]